MSANKENNDWDDEDETWDDWGDAEDQMPKEEAAPKAKAEQCTTTDENIKSTKSNSEEEQSKVESSFWKPWGGMVSTVLSTATNITSTVSQGLNQVIGVPSAEEMARINAEEQEVNKVKQAQHLLEPTEEEAPKHTESDNQGFGLGLVTTLGSKVLNTGLDTLEGIGKKTMNMLQENDPMLKNKRKILGLDAEKPNLSEILQEAKKDAEQLEHTLQELQIEKSKEMLRFECLFENNCGLVHLEALEILSKESALKIQTLLDSVSGNALKNLQETIDEVKELLEFEEIEADCEGNYSASDLKEKLQTAIEDADLSIHFEDIVSNWSQSLQWLNEKSSSCNEQEIFAQAITTLAETSALEMNKLHKIAELLLVKEHHSTANEVDAIVQLCKQFGEHLHGLVNRYAAILGESAEGKNHVRTLFTEMLVATQHIEKAFHLFLPILQMGAV